MAKLITQILHIIKHINGIQNYGRLWFPGYILARAQINRTQITVIK